MDVKNFLAQLPLLIDWLAIVVGVMLLIWAAAFSKNSDENRSVIWAYILAFAIIIAGILALALHYGAK